MKRCKKVKMKYLSSCQIDNFTEDYLVKNGGEIVIIDSLSGKKYERNITKVIWMIFKCNKCQKEFREPQPDIVKPRCPDCKSEDVENV